MSCNHSFWRDGICYFCRTEKIWKDIILADGCAVPACGVCYSMIEKGRKLAEERGFYDPSRLSISQKPATRNREIGKGDKNMAQIQEVQEKTGGGLPWLAKKTYQEYNIRHVKIATEAQMVDTEYQGKSTGQKPECEVETDSKECPRCIWTMNKKTQNYMVKKFGTDSSAWIGKEFDIKLARAGNANPSIYPKDLSLEEVIE